MITKHKLLSIMPNAFTLANAICGITALMVSVFYKTQETIFLSCYLILLGSCFDFFDGFIARKLNLTSALGKELDSFADLITFGVAPMCVFLSLHSIGNSNSISVIQILVVTFYIACAIFRLARYNVSEFVPFFEGLPSTFAGLLVSFYTLFSNIFIEHWRGNVFYSIISFSIIVLLGICMVSTLKVRRL